MPVAALLLSLAAPSSAAGASVKTLALRFAFNGPTHGVPGNHLDIAGTADIRPGAFVAEALVDLTTPDQPVVRIADVIDLDQISAAHAFGPAGATDLCPGAPVCFIRGGSVVFGGGFSPTADHDRQKLSYYLVVRAANIHYRVLHLNGWRPTRYAGAVERVTDAYSQGAGAQAADTEISVMTSVASTPTKGPTVGIAVPPCDEQGVGSLTLAGGRSPVPVRCGHGAVGAVSGRRTVWRMTGVAAGMTHDATRLLVIAS